MPTYEYECLECKHRFERFQSIKDEPVKVCEKCGKEVRKVFCATGIIFKGSGFYVNDSKSSKSTSASSDSSESGSCSGCSNSSSCDVSD